MTPKPIDLFAAKHAALREKPMPSDEGPELPPALAARLRDHATPEALDDLVALTLGSDAKGSHRAYLAAHGSASVLLAHDPQETEKSFESVAFRDHEDRLTFEHGGRYGSAQTRLSMAIGLMHAAEAIARTQLGIDLHDFAPVLFTRATTPAKDETEEVLSIVAEHPGIEGGEILTKAERRTNAKPADVLAAIEKLTREGRLTKNAGFALTNGRTG